MLVLAVLLVGFTLVIARTTDTLYARCPDNVVHNPTVILDGHSLAPNQYRVLVPLLHHAVDALWFRNPPKADRVVVYVCILICFSVFGYMVYSETGSTPAACIAMLAFLGCLPIGMMARYRQEWVEVPCVCLAVMLATRKTVGWRTYGALALVTVVGVLNRETFAFCLFGVASTVFWEHMRRDWRRTWPHVLGLLLLALVAAACYAAPRIVFGLRPYHCKFWVIGNNWNSLPDITNSRHILHMGSGLLLAYGVTLLHGARWNTPFMVGYLVPFVIVDTLISSFTEHRVFYPIMALFLVTIVQHITPRRVE